MNKGALSARVYGVVQGVSFRYYTRRKATALQLIGWVRNLPNGSVEVWAEGERGKLDELVEWLHHGPDFARVERVDVDWETPHEKYTSFEVTY